MGWPDDPGYTQERQASGYVSYALWHYTCYLVELRRFVRRYGGLWLLSDTSGSPVVEARPQSTDPGSQLMSGGYARILVAGSDQRCRCADSTVEVKGAGGNPIQEFYASKLGEITLDQVILDPRPAGDI